MKSLNCSYCERRCEIGEGGTGFCRMYTASDGRIVERFPYRWSTCGSYNLESMPFYHAYPGGRCLAIGTMGCNFSCQYCSNAYIAKEEPESQQDRAYRLGPRELVETARKLKCGSIVFNANEPTVSIPSLLEVAKEAEAASVTMGCLTNGYSTEEGTEILASIFSFFNVSLKGISASFNQEHVGIGSSEPVLRTIRRLARDRHVEVTTPIIEGVNDGEIDEMAGFLAGVDPEIPWHVFRLLPEDEMKEARYPNIQSIDAALESAKKKLAYVYFHNFVGSEWVNTLCPACGSTLIERFSLGCGGDKLKRFACPEGKCPDCGRGIRLLTQAMQRQNTEGAQQ